MKSAVQFKKEAKGLEVPKHIDKPDYAKPEEKDDYYGRKTDNPLTVDSPEVKAAKAEANKRFAALKRVLKNKSKNDLIVMLVTYASDVQEYQQISKDLLAENDNLRAMVKLSQKYFKRIRLFKFIGLPVLSIFLIKEIYDLILTYIV